MIASRIEEAPSVHLIRRRCRSLSETRHRRQLPLKGKPLDDQPVISYDVSIKVGRNATAFLENATGIRWYRTLSGGAYGIRKAEISQNLYSLPLEGKVPAKRGNEVENYDMMLLGLEKPLLSIESSLPLLLPAYRDIFVQFIGNKTALTDGKAREMYPYTGPEDGSITGIPTHCIKIRFGNYDFYT